MALNPTPIGKAIADYLWSARPPAGTESGLTDLEAIWEGVMTLIYDDIKATMVVKPQSLTGPNLNDPSGQTVTIPTTSAPGTPSTGSVTSQQDIAGTGSVE